MPRHDSESKVLTRRSALLAAAATTAGLGGVYGLSRSGAARAEIESNTNLKDASLVLDSDGNVEDVTLSGVVRISYESPDIPIRKAAAKASLDYHGRADGSSGPKVDGPLVQSKSSETEGASKGTLAFRFDNLSLIKGWGFKPSDFEPKPGETVEHKFLLVASSAIYETVDSEEPLETVTSEDYGVVKVERKQASTGGGGGDNGGGGGNADREPVLTLVSSEFAFAVETESA